MAFCIELEVLPTWEGHGHAVALATVEAINLL